MKSVILAFTVFATLFTSQAFAASHQQGLIQSLTKEEKLKIEKLLIEQAEKEHPEFAPFDGFRIEWDLAKCIQIYSEMDETYVGTCILSFNRWQFGGEAALNIKTAPREFVVSILTTRD